ncbi:hypothetical protein CPB84DRAFT_1803855 [Gymnopilus junonius]|uniref:F-box domain-containing protein n=1 Tax=Gymnopilus junonius TaxID=109634 RepID=A0A9P5N7Z6_GYMJU|nr:hypothetical protein CPB84DRAFT_1803855 [Gymnopilus junonius]
MPCIFCADPGQHPFLDPPNACQLSEGSPCAVCNKMQRVEQEIQEAEQRAQDAREAHSKLLEKRREIRTQRNRIHDPIFSHFPPRLHPPYFDVMFSLILGSVCRDWRRLAWSSPHIWTYVLLRIDSTILPQHIDTFREWLRRSGTLPLSIRVYCNDEEDLKPTEATNTLTDMINQESSRWQMLDLRIPDILFSKFTGVGDPKGSILKSLRLEPFYSDPGFKMHNLIPSPVNVFVREMRYSLIAIQWSNVTRVQAQSIYINECLELLANAPQIRQCVFNHIVCPDNWMQFSLSTSPVIVHHQIEDLSLELAHLAIKAVYEAPLLSQLRLFITGWTIASEAEAARFYSPEEFFKLLVATSITTDDKIGGQGSEPDFLPNLESLHYEIVHSFSWNLIPAIFGPPTALLTPDAHRRRYPPILDKQTTHDFLLSSKLEILQTSMDHHGITDDSDLITPSNPRNANGTK